MNAPPYIPPADAGFDSFLHTLSTALTANPIDFGLTAPDAVIIAAQYTAWHAAYLTATNPATRTSPTIAAKDAARVLAVGTIRPYCQQIAKNPSVSDELKLSVGLNPPNNVPVPIPPITDVPQLLTQPSAPGQVVLQYRSGENPTSKAKPFGAVALELWRNIGAVAATNPAQCALLASLTKTPQVIDNDPATPGQTMTYFGRWTTLSGPQGKAQKGPWSLPLVVIAQ